MTLEYELYWSFRSPYSYLVTPRLVALEAEYDVRCIARPIYPIAVRTPEFFDGRDPRWFSYFMKDVFREAEFLGLPMRWPQPDPVSRGEGRDFRVPQPHIHRLTHLGVAAQERGRGLPFLDEASRVIWSGAVDNWHEGDHLAGAAARAGLDFSEMAAAVDADPDRYAAIVKQSQGDQSDLHWGVPLMVFEGEPFFGQDRFDQLKWRMERAGMRRR